MKKIVFAAAMLFLVSGLPGIASADIDSLIKKLNVEAKADIGKYSVKLSSQFGVPEVQVKAILNKVDSPADAFLCLQVGKMANTQPEAAVQVYQQNKGKGWGAIAQSMGIKPGSPEFHALKRGDFALTGEPGASGGSAKGQGQVKGKGKGKGRGRD